MMSSASNTGTPARLRPVRTALGSGPMLVGHAHPEATAAAQERIAQGTTFFANNRWGIELAEAIVAAVPCADQVRFVSTGSETDLYAIKLVFSIPPDRPTPNFPPSWNAARTHRVQKT